MPNPTNTTPFYTAVPVMSFVGPLITANTTRDGSTGLMTLVYTVGASGGILRRIRCISFGTNAQTAWRIFYNNGGVTTTASNNALQPEKLLPVTAASETTALPPFEAVFGDLLPPGTRIYVTLGTAGTAGWEFTAFGEDFT